MFFLIDAFLYVKLVQIWVWLNCLNSFKTAKKQVITTRKSYKTSLKLPETKKG